MGKNCKGLRINEFGIPRKNMTCGNDGQFGRSLWKRSFDQFLGGYKKC